METYGRKMSVAFNRAAGEMTLRVQLINKYACFVARRPHFIFPHFLTPISSFGGNKCFVWLRLEDSSLLSTALGTTSRTNNDLIF